MHRTTTARENQHQTRHEETMTALAQQGESMRQQGEALHVLIERTVPQS